MPYNSSRCYVHVRDHNSSYHFYSNRWSKIHRIQAHSNPNVSYYLRSLRTHKSKSGIFIHLTALLFKKIISISFFETIFMYPIQQLKFIYISIHKYSTIGQIEIIRYHKGGLKIINNPDTNTITCTILIW